MKPFSVVLLTLLVLAAGFAIFWVGLKINYEMDLAKQQKIRDTYGADVIID